MATTKVLSTIVCLLSMTAALPNKEVRQSPPPHSTYMTYYNPNGVGACGTTSGSGDFVVALPSSIYSQDKCGSAVTVNYNGKSATGTVVDQCSSCGDNLDVSEAMFAAVADPNQGSVPVVWSSNSNY